MGGGGGRSEAATPTSGAGLGEKLLDNQVVGGLRCDARVLHQLLLDGYTNVVLGEQVLQLLEGLEAVIALLVDDGYVAPAHAAHNVHHGLHLVVVRRDGPRKVFEALLVAQLGTRREEGDLEGRNRRGGVGMGAS